MLPSFYVWPFEVSPLHPCGVVDTCGDVSGSLYWISEKHQGLLEILSFVYFHKFRNEVDELLSRKLRDSSLNLLNNWCRQMYIPVSTKATR